jgi:PAS domain S-box-containing protein
MNVNQKPSPIDQEVDWDKTESIISKTDQFGTIDYCNEVFCEVSGYNDFELMNSAHNIVRHPDMPKIIYKILWENLKNDVTITALIKNLSKSGKYYWVEANFTILKDVEGNNQYFSKRKGISQNIVNAIEPIYQKLLVLESEGGIEASEKYLINYFKEENTNYNDFINNLLKINNK